MNGIVLSKQVALEQKLTGLDREFCRWRKLTDTCEKFKKHQSQVRALTGHLAGLRDETNKLFAEVKAEGTILKEARNLESLALGIRRIWEFFRSKLVQRWDPDLYKFLELADELAWACYSPVLKRSVSDRREPPLVFLNGGMSPYALSRDRAFPAEEVPGEALTPNTYDSVLQHLPIPVIGVPWYQTAHLPDLPVVAHETGHAVEQDFGLHAVVVARIRGALEKTPGAAHLPWWESWSREVFADLWGCLTLGPGFVSSLLDFLATDQKRIENEIAAQNGSYPTAHLRMLLCLQALKNMGFNEEASDLLEKWSLNYRKDGMVGFEQDVPEIVDAILAATYPTIDAAAPLFAIDGLRFTENDQAGAKEGAARQERNRDPTEEATTVVRLVAATRISYDRDPNEYASKKRNESFVMHAAKLIKPGTRAGEKIMSDDAKRASSDSSRDQGAKWFDKFAEWAGSAN